MKITGDIDCADMVKAWPSPDFTQLPAITKADMLQDALEELVRLYNEAVDELRMPKPVKRH